MFKWIILAIIGLWAAGLLLGKKRRVVHDAAHVVRLIAVAALVFMGYTAIVSGKTLAQAPFLRLVVMAAWAAAAWYLVKGIERIVLKDRKK
ncbi:MAG: hypothetical protein AB7E47_08780 [Desulfovibrionaceae bacterium]